MTESHRIWGIFKQECGSCIFDRLADAFPEFASSRSFDATLPSHDPRINQIEKILWEGGLRSWARKGTRDRVHEYCHDRYRRYDRSDWETAEWLTIRNGEPNPGRIRSARRSSTEHWIDLSLVDWNDTLIAELADAATMVAVPARIRRLLEARELVGLSFRDLEPVVFPHEPFVGGQKEWDAHAASFMPRWEEEPWYELDSLVELPPVSPSMSLHPSRVAPSQQTGFTPERGDLRSGYLPLEPSYNDRELHYLRSEMDAMPAFDIARTFEPFGQPCPDGQKTEHQRLAYCPLVFSQRFYRVCVEEGVKANWVPVRIDED